MIIKILTCTCFGFGAIAETDIKMTITAVDKTIFKNVVIEPISITRQRPPPT